MRLIAGPASEAPKSSISMIGRIVLLTNWIPRGKGKAPEQVRGEVRAVTDLLTNLNEARNKLQQISAEHLEGHRSIGKHPFFGELSARQWLRFIEVHHRHHERIVRDIAQATS